MAREDDPDRNGQDLSTLLAKMLRIDPTPSDGQPYTVPGDNPFVDRQGARPEIYSYGLRNPWRFSFDSLTGALSIGDVGQNEFEEVDLVGRGDGRGANFGWSAYEGLTRFNDDQSAKGAIPPVLVYSHDDGCSITGGYVVRDTRSAVAVRPLPLRRLLRRASCGASPRCPGARRPTTARSGSRSRS